MRRTLTPNYVQNERSYGTKVKIRRPASHGWSSTSGEDPKSGVFGGGLGEQEVEDPKRGGFGGALASGGREDLKTSCRNDACLISAVGKQRDPLRG